MPELLLIWMVVFRKVGFKFQNVLTNNRDMYNPDNGVITNPKTGFWALTISAEVTTGFDSLYVGEPYTNPRIWTFTKEDTSSSLLFRNLSYGDRLFWYSTFNETLTATRSSISGWLIGPSKGFIKYTKQICLRVMLQSNILPFEFQKKIDRQRMLKLRYFKINWSVA